MLDLIPVAPVPYEVHQNCGCYHYYVQYHQKREKPSVRLEVLNRTNDGFEIAAEDLKLRGPGEILGVRQSGELAFAIGDVFADSKVLTQAAEAASEILQKDAALSAPEHCKLLNKLQLYMNEGRKKLNI